ncbi:SCAN domain-containing protein 3-like [Parasteatoda tepidariorum]|uniref:SCAN domain-containing protein 3-like n=1 Tax=Parasteatoda tepidariorum TaxID=114398 RepID=UPI0039BD384E
MKHEKSAESVSSSTKLDGYLKNDDMDVINAEMLFTSFLIEHNVPLTAADHAGQLFRKMFPKSNIAKQYGCGRTKTSALVYQMASDHVDSMIKLMQHNSFSTACDGSNDVDHKLYPVVISYFNPDEGLIQSNLLSVSNLSGDGTGQNISSLILDEFKKFDIPFGNCVSFMSDNAAVMQGKRNGVIAHLKQQHDSLISARCACHLINLAAEKAAAILPINVDEILVDIYYYLNKSAKRKDALKHFQALHDKEAHKILKHVCTRWLSLGRSLSRLMEQWDPLVSFFKESVKSQSKTVSVSLSTYQIPKKAHTDLSVSNTCTPKVKSVPTKRKATDEGSSSSKQPKFDTHDYSKILSREEKLFVSFYF